MCNFIALIILLTGMCVSEVKADPVFLCPQTAVITSTETVDSVLTEDEQLEERYISKKDPWCSKKIAELELGANELIAMIIRGDETIIPDGKTILCEKDVVVLYK